MIKRMELNIHGIVQGTGLRPYIYNLARKFNLAGFVLNDSKGVVIEIEGQPLNIKKFFKALKKEVPRQCFIGKVTKKALETTGQRNFIIKESLGRKDKFVFIPKDSAVCPQCLKELFDEKNGRHLYPFINCVDCGPRFTIIRDIPYDRPKTTMKSFKMCSFCSRQYQNYKSRRFYAQPTACFKCGPALELSSNPLTGIKKISKKETVKLLKQAAQLFNRGAILAIKGLGGYHIACDAKNRQAVEKLRQRKSRPAKPFALMADNLRAIERICFINAKEKETLLSPARPIVLLKIKKHSSWMDIAAPGQKYLGFMLSYTPLHSLMFHFLQKCQKSPVLVMTSANKKDFPLIASESEAAGLKNYVDFFLTHNRPIHIRCDDSITRVFKNRTLIIRKARGYTPDFMEFNNNSLNILGCGGELKNTFCLSKNNYLISSAYIGDLTNYPTYRLYLKLLRHYQKIFNFRPDIAVSDCHPAYLSTQYARSLNIPLLEVQHHHAHLAACLFENRVREKVIGICFDGTGFGLDEKSWGGEFFIADTRSFCRLAHFKYLGLIGADKAVEEPARTAFYILYNIFGRNVFNYNLACLNYFDKKTLAVFEKLIQTNQVPYSSSCGRIFDAVAGLIGIKFKISYEAEAAIDLEMLALSHKNIKERYDFAIVKENAYYVIDWRPMFKQILQDKLNYKNIGFIAAKFHYTIACIAAELSGRIRKEYGINKVALSGGVFQNMFLLEKTVNLLAKNNFKVYYHRQTPFNDAAISIGQAVVASGNADRAQLV